MVMVGMAISLHLAYAQPHPPVLLHPDLSLPPQTPERLQPWQGPALLTVRHELFSKPKARGLTVLDFTRMQGK
jgi:hypothetical protein